jgi:hypothetical protein
MNGSDCIPDNAGGLAMERALTRAGALVRELASDPSSEQRTQVWSERIAYRDGEQGRDEHKRDAHDVPEPSPGNESLVAVVSTSAMIHVSVPQESPAAAPKV